MRFVPRVETTLMELAKAFGVAVVATSGVAVVAKPSRLHGCQR
jgi:hypothetical protein